MSELCEGKCKEETTQFGPSFCPYNEVFLGTNRFFYYTMSHRSLAKTVPK